MACSSNSEKQVVISGNWNKDKAKVVNLYQVVLGRLDTLCTYVLQEDKTFGFSFTPKQEGFYAIGTSYHSNPQDKYIFYFKPGDALSVTVNDSTFVLTGKNTEENLVMEKWHQRIGEMEHITIFPFKTPTTYKEFFPMVEAYLSDPFVPKATKNKVFNEAFKKFQSVDFLNITTGFIFTPRMAHPGPDDFPDFYRNINVPEITQDNRLLDYPYGIDMLPRVLGVKNRFNNEARTATFDEMLSEVTNELLKGEMVIQRAGRLRSFVDYLDLIEKYGHFITLPDQQKRSLETKIKLAQSATEPGKPAVNFSGTDVNGKILSLSDFKGKMVYVDIWATWCGPCTQEIPNMEKLIAEYKGKNIVFLGVSVDEAKDKEKWQNFVKERALKGVQIYAGNGWESDINKFYQVKGIPRFLLIDKKGNIVTIDAPRPSTQEIRNLINKGLKE
jgi:thiol-disulfide isomerase/thioredoxin